MEKAFINCSGGKDCTMALHKVMHERIVKPELLFTTVSKELQRVSMHGVRKELITRQAMALGIHSRKMYLPESNDTVLYEKLMDHEMTLIKVLIFRYSEMYF
jgi:diphthamide synthase (EF-2-diphthine--ammonia ligase)